MIDFPERRPVPSTDQPRPDAPPAMSELIRALVMQGIFEMVERAQR